MTTVYTSPLASSDPKAVGTHFFIVGVGEYPSLLGGDPKQLLEDPMSLKQLSSPPVSAAALASWVLGRQGPSRVAAGFHNPNAPLATVEMLLSPSQSYMRTDGAQVSVEAASRPNIAQGFARWKERAAAHTDNAAVFYFCGHGLSGTNDYLLPSDFGVVHRENPWADAIDITDTARAMRRLASGPLYFLIDACRQASRNALSPGASPPALAFVDFKKPVRCFTRLILWATGEGEAAFGAKADASRFCAALLKALSGYEAEEVPEGKGWMVTGDLLARTVRRILDAENASLEPGKRQYVEQQLIGSQAFHFETLPPGQISRGIPSSWSVGPKVRQLLTAWGVGDTLPDKALEVLAEKQEAKQLQVQALEEEVREWTRRYDELKRDLEAEPDSELSQRARAFLEAGKLHEAGTAYEALIKTAEGRRDAESARVASYSLNRGRIFLLDFKPLEALPYYEKAYCLCPDRAECALGYAVLLIEQRDYRRAEPVLMAALARMREAAQANPAAYRSDIAMTLNSLGLVHAEEHLYAEARQAYEAALAIHRELAQTNPAAYRPDVAATLNNLGTLHAEEHLYAEARQAYEAALAIHRELAQANPAAYRPDVAATLNNLGTLHAEEHLYAEARQAYEAALAIHRELAQANPAAYGPAVAGTLNNLGALHYDEHRYAEARQVYEAALAIRRELAQANPAAYRPGVAETLNNLGLVHAIEHRYAEARQAFEAALAIRRELAQANPAAYRPAVAKTLNDLGTLHADEHRYAEARQAFEAALAIRRELAQANPAAYRPDVAETLYNLGALHYDEHRYAEARQAYEAALAIHRELAQASPAAYRPDVAGTLNNLGTLHYDEHRYAEARQAFEEALRIYQELAATAPAQFAWAVQDLQDRLSVETRV
jgi:tetratricopeptide (TPR) repeat protein